MGRLESVLYAVAVATFGAMALACAALTFAIMVWR